MTSEWSINNSLIAYLKKLKQHKQFFFTAQTSTNKEDYFGWIWSVWGAGDVIAYNSKSNILKTEAAQTKLLPAQTSTNEAQTIEPVLGELGAYGGLSDLRKRTLNIILIS